MIRAAQYGRRGTKPSTPREPKGNKLDPNRPLSEGEEDWATPCSSCGNIPTVHPTRLCGPCCFGDASTAGGNWK